MGIVARLCPGFNPTATANILKMADTVIRSDCKDIQTIKNALDATQNKIISLTSSKKDTARPEEFQHLKTRLQELRSQSSKALKYELMALDKKIKPFIEKLSFFKNATSIDIDYHNMQTGTSDVQKLADSFITLPPKYLQFLKSHIDILQPLEKSRAVLIKQLQDDTPSNAKIISSLDAIMEAISRATPPPYTAPENPPDYLKSTQFCLDALNAEREPLVKKFNTYFNHNYHTMLLSGDTTSEAKKFKRYPKRIQSIKTLTDRLLSLEESRAEHIQHFKSGTPSNANILSSLKHIQQSVKLAVQDIQTVKRASAQPVPSAPSYTTYTVSSAPPLYIY